MIIQKKLKNQCPNNQINFILNAARLEICNRYNKRAMKEGF